MRSIFVDGSVDCIRTTSEGAGLISPELWSKAGIYLDLNTGAVFGESNARQIKPLYTGLILRRPELISAFHVKPIAFDDARPIAIESNANPIGKAAFTRSDAGAINLSQTAECIAQVIEDAKSNIYHRDARGTIRLRVATGRTTATNFLDGKVQTTLAFSLTSFHRREP